MINFNSSMIIGEKYWLPKTDRTIKLFLIMGKGNFIATKVKRSPTLPGLLQYRGKTTIIDIHRSQSETSKQINHYTLIQGRLNSFIGPRAKQCIGALPTQSLTGACYDFFYPSTTLYNNKGGISNVKFSYNTFPK